MTRLPINVLIAMVLSILSFSCKSKKNIVKQQGSIALQDTSADRCRMDFKNSKSLEKRMNDSELTFTYASAKFNCELTLDSEENSFTVSLRCRKDSVIWMSISKLGIDAARVLITKDSVKFTLGLTERKYFKGDFSYINEMLHADLDYDMIQSLLFGNSASFDNEEDKLHSGRDKASCLYFLSTVRRKEAKRITQGEAQPDETFQTIRIEPDHFKITRLEFTDVEHKRSFTSDYSDFKPLDKFLVPNRISINVTAEKNMKAAIKYSRISINEPQNFPFNIPASYERIIFKNK